MGGSGKFCSVTTKILKSPILFARTENVSGGRTKSRAARGYFYPDEIFKWIFFSFLVGGREVF